MNALQLSLVTSHSYNSLVRKLILCFRDNVESHGLTLGYHTTGHEKSIYFINLDLQYNYANPYNLYLYRVLQTFYYTKEKETNTYSRFDVLTFLLIILDVHTSWKRSLRWRLPLVTILPLGGSSRHCLELACKKSLRSVA